MGLTPPMESDPGLLDSISLVEPSGHLDIGGGDAVVPGSGCPQGEECANTVTFCGFCVEDDVPGNVAFGIVGTHWLGEAGALDFSNKGNIKQFGKPDSPSDVEAIKVGAAAHRAMQKSKGTRSDVNDAICKAFAAALAKGGGIADKTEKCPVCNVKFSRPANERRKKPKREPKMGGY